MLKMPHRIRSRLSRLVGMIGLWQVAKHRARPVLVVAALSSAALAQPKPTTTLSGQLELARVVDLAAERLDLNIEYDSAKLKGTVTLRLGAGVTDAELWSLTNRLLTSRGFTTVRRAGEATVSVVGLAEAAEAARVEPGDGLPFTEVPAGFRTEVVQIEHGNTTTVFESLQPLIGKTGRVTRIGTGDRLLVSATAEQHDLISRFLTDLDAPESATTVEEIAVHNLAVDRLMALAEQVQASRELVSGRRLPGKLVRAPDGASVLVISPESELLPWRTLIERLDRREPVTTQSYTPSHFGLDEVRSLIESTIAPTALQADDRWRVVTDALTGSLIVTATESKQEEIAALMQRLSDAPIETRRPMRSWTMKNRAVNEVISVLEGLISAGVLEATADDGTPQVVSASDESGADERSPSPGVMRSVPPQSAPLLPRIRDNESRPRSLTGSDDFTLTADVGTNTLIAVGSPRMLDQLEALLATIDVRQPQVMIEVLMVGLTDAETRDLAIQLEQIVTKGGTLVRLASLFGLSGIAANTGASGLSGAGGTAVVLDPGDFGVLVRALETINEGRTLSMPRVLATNNIAATFNSTVNEPYLSTNASDTVATTSFGGSESAGTQITITPQIASGDYLVLEYDVTLSAFVGESADPSLPPSRQQNVVSSTASIPDGYTVAVGGFEFTAEGKSTNQVPLIAKIPLLGELFKSRSASNTRTRFYVFIRANVLRSDGFDELKYLSDQWAQEASVDTGWPTVDPRVIK
jgi:type II secretory pathway component GspD/PulD (secretin)